jgi:hypothetical protein
VRFRNVEHTGASRTLCTAKDVSDPLGEPLLPVPAGCGVHEDYADPHSADLTALLADALAGVSA